MDHQPFGQQHATAAITPAGTWTSSNTKGPSRASTAPSPQKGPRTDGALYWKAYAQFKLGRRDEALATIAQLRKDYPQSRYLNDAKALERRRARQTRPEAIQDNDEIKLLAINAMQTSDPERAIPLLEGVLNATNSLRVKQRALYVLAQISNPRARQILLNYAKGAGNPDLQMEAIRYLAAKRDKQTTSTELVRSTKSTDDLARPPRDHRGVSVGRQQDGLVAHRRQHGGAPLAIRQQAISGLTNLAAPQELWALYQKETDKDLQDADDQARSARWARSSS